MNASNDFCTRIYPRTTQKITAQACKDVFDGARFVGVWTYSRWDDGIVTLRMSTCGPFDRVVVCDPPADLSWRETSAIGRP